MRAALVCYARDGLVATTMEAIADEAHIAVGTIYTYFRSKHELRAAITRLNTERTDALIAEFLVIRDPLEAIRQLLLTSIDMSTVPGSEQSLRIELQLWATSLTDDELHRWIKGMIEVWETVLEKLVRRGQRSGVIDNSLSPAIVARLLYSMVSGIALLHLMSPQKSTANDAHRRKIDLAIDHLLDGFCASGDAQ